MTRAELRLAARERQIRALYEFAVATAVHCGGRANPRCVELTRAALIAVWRALLVYGR
jgi:hypothetical protein